MPKIHHTGISFLFFPSGSLLVKANWSSVSAAEMAHRRFLSGPLLARLYNTKEFGALVAVSTLMGWQTLFSRALAQCLLSACCVLITLGSSEC